MNTTKIIIESKVYGRHEVLVDAADEARVREIGSWYIRRLGSEYNRKWYAEKKLTPKQRVMLAKQYPGLYINKSGCLRMHQLLMASPRGTHVDHINHDGLDNRKANLRHCTASQNSQNKRIRSDSRSGYKGVTPVGRKWMAYIGDPQTPATRKRQIRLGTFATKEEAALAYNKAARELYGVYAQLNDIQP